LDYNCNGIYGVAPNGKSWKSQLCENSGQMGVVVLGDSAGAHFAIPPQYFHPASINLTTYQNLGPAVEDEFDLPYRSGFTGSRFTPPKGNNLFQGKPSIPAHFICPFYPRGLLACNFFFVFLHLHHTC